MNFNDLSIAYHKGKDINAAVVEGRAFNIYKDFQLATTASKYFGITTGGRSVVLARASLFTGSGDFSFEVFEDSTFSSGTALTLNNLNRENPQATTVQTAVEDPTVSVEGTNILTYRALGDNASKSNLGIVSGTSIILASNTNYLLKFTHNEAGTRDFIVNYVVYTGE